VKEKVSKRKHERNDENDRRLEMRLKDIWQQQQQQTKKFQGGGRREDRREGLPARLSFSVSLYPDLPSSHPPL
jgi:hypothetical protein